MISFDVFDTLITRTTKNPHGIFYIMQERILAIELEERAFLGKNFAQIRMNAEKNAGVYSSMSREKIEVDLEAIYQVVMQMTGISMETKRKLMELEIQTEMACAVGIKDNILKLKQIIESGEHVILISDMYLSSEIIMAMLVSEDTIFKNIPIYVSNECGCTKQTGELFLYIKEKEKISIGQWTHYGDNEKSDIESPQKLGIKTVWLKKEELISWEKGFDESNCLETNVYWQLYAGVARTLRQNNRMTEYEKIGASFVGMILYPYVEWIIKNSIRDKIKTLYFVARDGYVLKKVADIIIGRNNLGIDTKYIYGSRMAWRIQDESEEKKRNLRLYLKQEIDFSEKFAFVEVNGTGYTMECLADIIRELYDGKIYVFYFSLKKKTEHNNCIFHTYLTAYDEIVEAICRAPHGPTMGYINKNQVIYPEIQKVDNELWEKSGLYEYVQGAEAYAEKITGMLHKLGLCADNRYLVKTLVDYAGNHPDEQILRFLANRPHNDGYSDKESVYAPVLSMKDIFNIYMWRTNEPIGDFYQGVNFKFSEFLLTPKDKKMISFYECNYYRLLGRMIHRYKGWSLWHKSRPRIRRKRVMVYAAGTMGQKIYHYVNGAAGYKVSAWIDKDYKLYRKQGYPVAGVDVIERKKFDLVAIAIKNKEIAENVRKALMDKGIAPEKIYDMDAFCAILNSTFPTS